MPPLIAWKKRYCLGIPEIDAQHRGLVDLINRLYAAMESGKALTMMSQTLDELIRYAEAHFSSEERLMSERGYSGLAEHRQQHAGFTKQVLELRDKYRKGLLTISIDTLSFLKDWWTNHILTADKAFARELGL